MVSPKSKSGFRGGRDSAAIQENIELLTGQRGNGLDRAITMRELASLGLINITRNSNGAVIPKPVPPINPDINRPVDIPHSPIGFAAFGGFGAIMLEWENPTFNGFAYAEVWRSAPNADGSVPHLEQAVLIATTPATVFGDIVNPGSTFYYWCRFININDIAGPYNNVDGVKASTSSNLSDIIDDIGKQMKESELVQGLTKSIAGIKSGVKSNSSAISTINKDGSTAHKAMWNTKAQAGDIKAGIGIIADSDGTSQVAVSASQFIVFDPNVDGGSTQPLFAIDKGNVIIPKAFIEKATIQILNAQTIIADEVKAGISINSPIINGGQVTGGWAGFGAGGRFNGWKTYINASGQIFTDGINAVNGSYSGHMYATSGEMRNILIHENCTIRGTLSASQIIGDLVKMVPVENGRSVSVNGWPFDVLVKLIPVRYGASKFNGQSGSSVRASARCKINGQEFVSGTSTYGGPHEHIMATGILTSDLVHVAKNVSITFEYSGGRANGHTDQYAVFLFTKA
ncbi:hypothetical protein C9J22_13035 [Photobacterium phosphoreum]|uniref:phage tail tip fiber protein n=1 Tax=Photobacterium phosphoreum TaxID=659 RepID=UPI000D165426|nr:DUF1983 domain-containing protein [Photobacterium phosphoreum]PSU69798.1 hypothetical protein C9J22_13035 [Photobacterium phosphoreum]